MGYFDRQRRKLLYESKLKKTLTDGASTNNNTKSNNKTRCFKVGQLVSYKNEEYVVKYCSDGKCVIQMDGKLLFVNCDDLSLVNNIKNGKLLSENFYQVTYSTDGVNYYSNVLVKADTEDDAKKIAINSAKVKPHADSKIIVTERDKLFVDDYHGRRGMSLIESMDTIVLGQDAINTVANLLQVGLKLTQLKNNHRMTMVDLDKIISNLVDLKDSIKSSNDYNIEMREHFDGETMPPAPVDGESTGVATLLNSLIKDEIEAIDGYNGAIQTLQSLDKPYDEIIAILNDISGEENIHIGQLLKALEIVNPQTTLIKDGEEEAEEVINSDGNNTDDEE